MHRFSVPDIGGGFLYNKRYPMTKKSDPVVKRTKKTAQLIDRTSRILALPEAEIQSRLSGILKQSVRINPLAATPGETLAAMTSLGWEGKLQAWCENGYSIDKGFETLRDSNLVTDGSIYIQNESSWLPVVLLNATSGESVLDICAAPGGKTSHIAAMMRGNGRLVANDNSRPRLAKLVANLKRLHVTADTTLYDATRIAYSLDESFDKILLDAPCSGEGLITLGDGRTLDRWSVAHIRRLSQLQKRLIAQAWQLLRPGGRLVYSTCTMAPEENEAVIQWLLKRAPDAHMQKPQTRPEGSRVGVPTWNSISFDEAVWQNVIRILPGDGREAFFVCVLEKGREHA